MKVMKTIDIDSRPDGIMFDPFNERVWVLSHTPPYAVVIDAKDGAVVGTVDLVGTAEQAISDGRGKVYINVSDKGGVAVVDAKTLKVTANYDMSAKGVHGSGMAVDAKNHILFAYYRDPKPVVTILNADTGNLLATFPTGEGVDTVAFNPATMEAISAANDGAMTIIKENSPTSFAVEQTLQLMPGTKTMALDAKTGHIFTMAAEYGPAPANAQPGPAGRPPRGPMVPGSFTVLMVGRK
jgi:DNA-binding beta-propeller fold protein YncE